VHLDGGSREPAFLTTEQRKVEAALSAVTEPGSRGVPEHLREPLQYALSTSGKRLRPVLCVAAYRAATGEIEPPVALYRLSCALELVHTYSLVHDDLPCMDDDDLRRGRPTVHRVFGNGRAILAGATLLPTAVAILDREGEALDLSVEARARLVVELCRAAGAAGMVGGQLLDLESEQKEIDPGVLESIHRRKTGALLTCALRIGALAGRTDERLLGALTRYGTALGLAFQIADDVLDIAGDPATLGKTAGRDLALRKASYPALYGLDGARDLARARAEEAKSALVGRDLNDLVDLADYVVERHR
jgi:geranylgeranyl diphosphate synthase, type II